MVEAGAGSPQVPIEAIFSEITEDSFSVGLVTGGAIAMSKTQRDAFWRIREEQPEGQRREGAQLKHDLSVPPQLLADFLERAFQVCQTILDGIRINPFGHLGDGNVHYNLSPPIGQKGFAVGKKPSRFGWGSWQLKWAAVLPPNMALDAPRCPCHEEASRSA